MRRYLDFIHKHGHFIRKTGHGLIAIHHHHHDLHKRLAKLQLGTGTVAQRHEEQEPIGTVRHHHKHNTKETNKPKRHIQSI